MGRPLQVLSLGAGVQSSTLLLMSCKGELPKLDAAVFADTQWESAAVYDNLEWLEREATRAGIRVVRVSNGSLRDNTTRRTLTRDGENSGMDIPAWTRLPDGTKGKINRTCTREFKIVPVERYLRYELLGLKPRQRAPTEAIHQWFGISADELRRVRGSHSNWKRNIYPLIGLPDDMLPKPFHRSDCVAWLSENYPGRDFPSSSCLGCPFHSSAEWRNVRKNSSEWEDVLEVDRTIRDTVGMKAKLFLHRSCVPLEEVDLRADHEKGQGLLFGSDEECLGVCGT